jgi:RNA polymerase sigma factor (sigma-70 family)
MPREPTQTRFATTHWSVVARAAAEETGEVAQAALSSLYRDYWPPVYAFVRARGYGRAQAEDLTQDFFLYLMEHRAYAKADSFKGRFRSFLLGWLKKFLLNAEGHERRLKRGGGQSFVFLDADIQTAERHVKELTVQPPTDEERLFEWHWASILISRAMERLEGEWAEKSRARVLRELKPFLQGGAGLPSLSEVAVRLELPAETVRVHLLRLRTRYRTLLRGQVAHTVDESADVEEELRFLCRVLMAGSLGFHL